MAALARAAVRQPVVPARVHVRRPARICRCDRRLDDHRGRPAALGRLWADAHRRRRFSIADGGDVLVSLLSYMAVYLIIFPAGILVMARIIRKGPEGRPSRRLADREPAGQASRSPSSFMPRERHDAHCPELRSRLDHHSRRRHLPLRPARRLRPRRRHPLRLRARPALPQHRHEFDRADLGRQRNMAGARRPRAARSLPACLRHHHPGAVLSGAGHAACAGVPRRGLRVPLPRRRTQDFLGSRLRLRLRRRRRSRKA